jgi:hypothetical protein
VRNDEKHISRPQPASQLANWVMQVSKHLRLDELRETGVADGMAAGQQAPVALALQAHLQAASIMPIGSSRGQGKKPSSCAARVPASCQDKQQAAFEWSVAVGSHCRVQEQKPMPCKAVLRERSREDPRIKEDQRIKEFLTGHSSLPSLSMWALEHGATTSPMSCAATTGSPATTHTVHLQMVQRELG